RAWAAGTLTPSASRSLLLPLPRRGGDDFPNQVPAVADARVRLLVVPHEHLALARRQHDYGRPGRVAGDGDQDTVAGAELREGFTAHRWPARGWVVSVGEAEEFVHPRFGQLPSPLQFPRDL